MKLLHFEDYVDRTLEQLTQGIRASRKNKIGDLTLRELAATVERPNGVYAIFDNAEEGSCLYVGKVSSQSYIARIAMHFDPREKSWMNQFVRKLRDSKFAGHYDEAHGHGLDQFVVFLGFQFAEVGRDDSVRKKSINLIESILRTYMKPSLNPRRGRYDGGALVSSLLS